MKRLGHALFFTAAFAACLWAVRVKAEEKKPVEIHALAVCEKGKCVVAEKDYKDLQEFVRMARKILAESAEMDEKRDDDLRKYQGALAVCRSQLEQRKE